MMSERNLLALSTGCDMPTEMVEPVEQRLKRRRENLANQIADIDKAIAALEAQPQLLETLNLLRKVGI